MQKSENAMLSFLADQYTLNGFSVVRNPCQANLPFDLGGYRPDLIATKDNSGLIVEVKDKLARLPVERFRALAQEVGRHPGWRFLLVTVDDEENSNLSGISNTIPEWSELQQRISQAHRLLSEGEKEPALLYLWSIFEALLRKHALNTLIPIERFPVLNLIKHLYSSGELSVSQYDLSLAILEIRNKLAHGVFIKVDPSLTNRFKELVDNLLFEWMP